MSKYTWLIEASRKKREQGNISNENTGVSSNSDNTSTYTSDPKIQSYIDKEKEYSKAIEQNLNSFDNTRINRWFYDAKQAMSTADSYLKDSSYNAMLNRESSMKKVFSDLDLETNALESFLQYYEGTEEGAELVSAFNNYKSAIDSYKSTGTTQKNYAESFINEEEFDNAMREHKYAEYSYDDIKKEIEKYDEDSEEYKWLTEKSKAVASSEDYQTEYDSNKSRMDEIHTEKQKIIEAKENSSWLSEQQAYATQETELDNEWDKLYARNHELEKLLKVKEYDEKEADYNNSMLDKYGEFTYEQLVDEYVQLENNEESSKEYKWLKNRAYEIGTSEQLQKTYDDNQKNMDDLHKKKRKIIEAKENSSWLSEQQAYATEEAELDNEWDRIYARNYELDNYISNKKRQEQNAIYEQQLSDFGVKSVINNYYLYNNGENFSKDKQKEVIADYENLNVENKEDLFKYYSRSIDERKSLENLEKIREDAIVNPIGSSVWSIGSKIVGAVPDTLNYLGAGINKAFGGDGYINPYETNVYKADYVQSVVSDSLGDVGGGVYNVAMGVIENLVKLPLLLVPGGKTISLTSSAMTAGVSSANTVMINGGSIEKALLTGGASAVAEAVFESISFDELKALKVKGADSVKKAIFKNGVVEGLEEVGTDITNAITDQIINCDLSQISLNYESYIKQGYTEEEAWSKCATDFALQVAQSFSVGAFAGGTLAGVTIGTQYIGNKISNSKAVQNVTAGKSIKSKENVSDLIKTAKTLSTDSKAYKLATKLEEQQNSGKKLSSSKVGELRSLIIEQSKEDYNTAYTEATKNLHAEEKAIIDKIARDESLTPEEMKIVNDNSTLSKSVEKITSAMKKQFVSSSKAEFAPFTSIDDNAVDKSKLNISKKSVTEINDKEYTGAMEIVRTNPDTGVVTYKIEEDGKEVEVTSEEIGFGSYEDAYLDAVASKHNVQTAQKLIELYEEGQVVEDYATEFNLYQNYGRLAIPLTDDKMSKGHVLNNDQKLGAYEVGVDSRKSYYQTQTIIANNAKNSKRYAYKEGTFDASVIKDIELNDTQKAFYNFLREFALRTGLKIELFASEVINGEYIGEQGSFNKNTGTIRIDINAGLKKVNANDVKHGMLNTFAHELTHVAELGGFYEELHDAVVKAFEKQGKSFDELVENKRDKILRNQSNAKNMSEEKLAYLADTEVIADACETMLKNSKIFEDIAQGNPSLAQKIKNALRDFINRIKEMLGSMEALTDEGIILEKCVNDLEQIQKLWDKAVTSGIKTLNATKSEQKNNTTVNSGVKQSNRYTYSNLISKPDMKITLVDDIVLRNISKTERKNIVNKAVENAKSVGYTNENGNAVVRVDDIATDVIISKRGLQHGLDRRLNVLAPVTVKAGEILKNAIRINDLNPRQTEVSESYILIGIAKNSKNEPYIVSFVVNKQTNIITSFDVLYSINTKTEPAGSLSPDVPTKVDHPTGSTISIADLLDYVNKYYPDILPEDVLKHYGYNSRPNGKLGENVLYQYAGRKSKTADIQQLQKAEDMERKGVDSEIIRKETGWFRGYDKEWRYEIDDSKMKFLVSPSKVLAEADKYHKMWSRFTELIEKKKDNKASETEIKELRRLDKSLRNYMRSDETRLSNYIYHPELFKAYPQLEDVPVVFDYSKNSVASYDPLFGIISVNPNAVYNDYESVLAHELQHMIQGIEGFAKGTSEEYWQTKIDKGYRKVKYDKELAKLKDEYDELLANAPEELRKQIDEYNRLIETGEEDKALELAGDICDGEYGLLYAEIRGKEATISAGEKLNYPMTAMDLYENTAGEIEARDTQYRLYYTEKQRKEIKPDIDTIDVVFAEDGVKYQARNTKPDYDFRKALTKEEKTRFYSALSNNSKSLLIGDNGVLLVDYENTDNYKLICYDGDKLFPRITNVYKIEGFDYNIYNSRRHIIDLIVQLEKECINNESSNRTDGGTPYKVLRDLPLYTGEVFRKYNIKTRRFNTLVRGELEDPNISRKNDKNKPNRAGLPESTGEGVPDNQVNEVFQMRTDGTYSNRTLLANALEASVQNEVERNLIKAYKEGISQLDEMEAKLRDVKAQIKEISFTKGSDRSRLLKFNNQKKMLTEKISRKDKQLLKLESMDSMQKLIALEKDKAIKRATDKMNQVVKEVKKQERERAKKLVSETREKYQKTLQEVREGRDKKIIAEREKRKSQIKKFRNNRERTEYVEKIRKLQKKFTQMLLNPTDKSFVIPDCLKGGFPKACKLITDAVILDNSTQAGEALEEVSRTIAKLIKENDTEASLLKDEFSTDFKELVDTLSDSLKGKKIGKNLTLDEAEDIYNILKQIYDVVRTANKMLSREDAITVSESSEKMIDELGKSKENKGVLSKGFMQILSPIRVAQMHSGYSENSELMNHIHSLDNGEIKASNWEMNARKPFEALEKSNSKAYDKAITEVETIEYIANNGDTKTVKMTRMQGMQILLSWEREAHNPKLVHMQTGGIVLPDAELMAKGKFEEAYDKKQTINGINYFFVKAIADTMTDFDWLYIGLAKKYFNEVSKKAINEVSLKLKHREVATEDYYIPFSVDNRYLATEYESVKFDATLENAGKLKSLVVRDSKPIVIAGLNNVLNRDISDTARLYGLAVPLRDFKKAFKLTSRENITANDGTQKNVSGESARGIINDKWGEEGSKFYDRLVSDLTTERKSDNPPFVKPLNKLRSAKITSVFTANLGITIKQLSAYPSALVHLSHKALAKGLSKTAYIFKNWDAVCDEIDSHTSLHYKRRKGLSSREMSEFLNTKLSKKMKNIPSVLNPTKWIQCMDCYITAMHWEACKAEIASKFEVGTEEYWDEVTNLYNKVINDTQQNYDVMHTAEVTKSKNGLWENIFMFRTEPLQHTGVLYKSVMEYSNTKSKESKSKLIKAIASQIESAVVYAGLGAFVALLLHKLNPYKDEDDEITPQSVLTEIGTDIFENIAGLIAPIGGESIAELISAFVTGEDIFDTELMVIQVINDLNDVFYDTYNTVKSVAYKLSLGLEVDYSAVGLELWESVKTVLEAFGVPLQNIENIFTAIPKWVGAIPDSTNKPSSIAKQYGNAYTSGDTEKAKEKLETLYQQKLEEYKVKKETNPEDFKGTTPEKKARNSVRDTLLNAYKKEYQEAFLRNNTKRMQEIVSLLQSSGYMRWENKLLSEKLSDWRKSAKEDLSK